MRTNPPPGHISNRFQPEKYKVTRERGETGYLEAATLLQLHLTSKTHGSVRHILRSHEILGKESFHNFTFWDRTNISRLWCRVSTALPINFYWTVTLIFIRCTAPRTCKIFKAGFFEKVWIEQNCCWVLGKVLLQHSAMHCNEIGDWVVGLFLSGQCNCHTCNAVSEILRYANFP